MESEENKIKSNRQKLSILQFETNKQCYSNILEGEIEMKGITLRKDGRYMIRKMIDGKSIIKYAKSINDAKKIYTKLKKNKLEQIKSKTKIKQKNLQEWGFEWLELYKKPFVKSKTLSDIKSVIKVISNSLGNIPLNELDPQIIQKFLNQYDKSRKKERIQTYFNALLQKAEDLSIISKNPFKAVIKEKKGNWKRECFNFEEQKLIIEHLKDTDIEHEIYIYLMTGCRPNELPHNENFNFEDNIITINGTKNKNAKCRLIEMSKNFANYIKQYLKNNTIKSVAYIKEKFKELCKILNIKNPLLYRLRHTFATNHFTLGTSAKYVQNWLGHYSVSMTLDTYTDIDKTATKTKIRNLYNNFYYEIV